MQEGIESTGEFVISGGDATELLEPIEEALNQMAGLVAIPINGTFALPVATGRNVGASACRFDGLDQFVTVVTFVGSDGGGWDASYQRRALGDIGDLSSGQIRRRGLPKASTLA